MDTNLVLTSIKAKLTLMETWDKGGHIWMHAAEGLAQEVKLLDEYMRRGAILPEGWKPKEDVHTVKIEPSIIPDEWMVVDHSSFAANILFSGTRAQCDAYVGGL